MSLGCSNQCILIVMATIYIVWFLLWDALKRQIYKFTLHILEWPFIVASLRHTCAIIMLSNQHLDMPHLWGGWIISAEEKCSLKPYSDGNCFSGGRKWFSPYTGFNCRPNPGCLCFSLTTLVKIPSRITYCFLTNTEVVW